MNEQLDALAANFERVHARIRAAALAAGREPSSVRLIAASKTKPPELLRAAYALGQRDFGENYVQELEDKAAALADLPELRFHLIGHLQRNKVKPAARCASVIQSVSSLRLVEELAKRSPAPIAEPKRFTPLGAIADGRLVLFVEVNVGGEAQKSGVAPEELGAVLDAIDGAPSLRLAGLMTIPPVTDDAAGAAPFFEQLVALREQHGGSARLPELSMGMSSDLEVAIGAGATLVRVGTDLFGARGARVG